MAQNCPDDLSAYAERLYEIPQPNGACLCDFTLDALPLFRCSYSVCLLAGCPDKANRT
jgi:hypothetical protein